GQGGEEGGVTITRHDLGRDRLRLKAETRKYLRLDIRANVAVGSDRAAQLSRRDLGGRRTGALEGARQLGCPARGLETEGDRLGVSAVRPADHDRTPMPLGEAARDLEQVL